MKYGIKMAFLILTFVFCFQEFAVANTVVACLDVYPVGENPTNFEAAQGYTVKLLTPAGTVVDSNSIITVDYQVQCYGIVGNGAVKLTTSYPLLGMGVKFTPVNGTSITVPVEEPFCLNDNDLCVVGAQYEVKNNNDVPLGPLY